MVLLEKDAVEANPCPQIPVCIIPGNDGEHMKLRANCVVCTEVQNKAQSLWMQCNGRNTLDAAWGQALPVSPGAIFVNHAMVGTTGISPVRTQRLQELR